VEVPFSIARRAHFVPVGEEDGQLEVWHTREVNPQILDDFRMGAQSPLHLIEVVESRFLDALQRSYDSVAESTDQIIEDLSLDELATELAEKSDLLESEDDAPVIQLVNSIIVQALRNRASDIHIEPFEDDIIVRFRVDGVLHNILHPPKPVQAPLMSRIKVMSNLNIAEKRLPQDGSMRVNVAQKEVDVRVSVLPTAHGERIVLRLLNKDTHLTSLLQLGLGRDQESWVRERLNRTHGIILVTGPTGSGKSTTLYAALNSINTSDKNIITIEDPIEYSLKGVGQIQVNPKIDLTFASGLRSILRQDPDVIMVGEIRDQETAEIAIQASLTGHLVFSTLHTNDSVGAIARLVDMGVEPFLVGASLEGVIAQRLVRRLCDHCKEPYEPPQSMLDSELVGRGWMQEPHFHRPKGCSHCMGTGYLGRTAIFEMLTVTDPIRDLMTRGNATDHELREVAAEEGMVGLRESGWIKAAEGETSIEEIYRVTQEENRGHS